MERRLPRTWPEGLCPNCGEPGSHLALSMVAGVPVQVFSCGRTVHLDVVVGTGSTSVRYLP